MPSRNDERTLAKKKTSNPEKGKRIAKKSMRELKSKNEKSKSKSRAKSKSKSESKSKSKSKSKKRVSRDADSDEEELDNTRKDEDKDVELEDEDDDDDDEHDEEEEEEEEEPDQDENENEDEEDEEQEEEEQEDEEGEEDERRVAERLKRAKDRKKRANRIAKSKGYRKIAKIGGVGTKGVAANILSLHEVGRLCQFVPQDAKSVAFSSIDEFGEKLKLAHESLPKAPRAVFRASMEVVARQAAYEIVLRSYENSKKTITAHAVYQATRPLMSALGTNAAFPLGLVRHAQTTMTGKNPEIPALDSFLDDEIEMREEAKLLPKQYEMAKAKDKERKAIKAARAAKKAENAAARQAPAREVVEA